MNKIDILIGKELKIARMKRRLSQQQVADTLGVSRQIISFWENGQRSMNVADYIRLAETLGIDPDITIKNVLEITQGQ